MSVSVGVGSGRHARVQRRIAQQRLARCAHAFVRRADQGGAARFKRFGTLGIVAQHEHGHVEGRCFLLHAARIRQHEGASCHEVGEIGVSERFDEGDARMPAQRPLGYRAHGGVLVHGVHHAHVSVGVCRVAYCSEHALHRFAQVLAPMARQP